tara:strand:+ start:505 stop:720 length:216 start_codon:yes stop_codon:yes gene_type:complete
MTPDEIRQARQSLGLTQSQMADMLGYGAAPRITEIERGARCPSDSVVRLIHAYLDGYRPEDWPERQQGDAG